MGKKKRPKNREVRMKMAKHILVGLTVISFYVLVQTLKSAPVEQTPPVIEKGILKEINNLEERINQNYTK